MQVKNDVWIFLANCQKPVRPIHREKKEKYKYDEKFYDVIRKQRKY